MANRDRDMEIVTEYEDINFDNTSSVANNEEYDDNTSILEFDCMSSLGLSCDNVSHVSTTTQYNDYYKSPYKQSLALISVKDKEISTLSTKISEKIDSVERCAQQTNTELLSYTNSEVKKINSEIHFIKLTNFAIIVALFALFLFNNYISLVDIKAFDCDSQTCCDNKSIKSELNETLVKQQMHDLKSKLVTIETNVNRIEQQIIKLLTTTTTTTTITIDDEIDDYYYLKIVSFISHFYYNYSTIVIIIAFIVLSKKLLDLRKEFEKSLKNIKSELNNELDVKYEDIVKLSANTCKSDDEIKSNEKLLENMKQELINTNENTIKSEFNKQFAIKDKEIETLNIKITELETELTNQLSLKDKEIAKLNDEMVRRDAKITQELENTKSELNNELALKDEEIAKLSAKTNEETDGINYLIKFMENAAEVAQETEDRIKSGFNKQFAKRDKEFETFNTKITEFVAELTKKLSLKDKEIAELSAKACKSDEEIKSNAKLVENIKQELIKTKSNLKSNFSEELEESDKEITINKFYEFERSMTTKLNDVLKSVETANRELAYVENELQNTKIAENKTETEFNTRLQKIGRKIDYYVKDIETSYKNVLDVCLKCEARLDDELDDYIVEKIDNYIISGIMKDLDAIKDESSPVGTIALFATETPPSGWLKMNRQHVSRTEYEKLFAAIGTKYGCGDGYSTFTLPGVRENITFLACIKY